MRCLVFVVAAATISVSGTAVAETVCDRPNGTIIMVRQENMIQVSFFLERDGNKMRGMARYNGGRGPVNGEIGANGGMYWQVFWENGEIGYYTGTLVNGVGEGVTHGNHLTRFRYIAATPPGCAKWSYLPPASPVPPPAQAPQVDLSSQVVSKLAGAGKVAVLPSEPGSDSIGMAKTFAGTWRTVANGGTWSFDMTFQQTGAEIQGDFVVLETGVRGRVSGNTDGTTLNFGWSDLNGYAGNGNVRLSEDGTSFEGSYSVTHIPTGLTADILQGTWHGRRR